jgi:hypothetical protein
MTVTSATGLQRADAEEEDDGTVVLLCAEVIELVHRAVEPTVRS